MFTKTAAALYREGGTGEDETAACAAHAERVNIVQQVRRARTAVVCASISGGCFTSSAVIVWAAYLVDRGAAQLLLTGGGFCLSGLFFIAYAIGVASRLLGYLHRSEELIHDLGDRVLQMDSIIIGLRLRLSLRAPQRAGESEDERWNEGCSSSDVIPFNKRH